MIKLIVTLYLYFVTTEDTAENFFVVEESTEAAEFYHEQEGGYDEGTATAELIMEIPSNIEAARGWTDFQLLTLLGAEILKIDPPMIVKFNEKVYYEGYSEYILRRNADDDFEASGNGRPNGTVDPIKKAIEYKEDL